jgi:hypothetical protein
MPGAQAVFTGLEIFLACIVAYLIGMTGYFLMHRTDPAVVPGENWPSWFKNLVHVYPTEYSKSATSNIIPDSTPNATFTAKTPKDCVTKKTKGCKDDNGCSGFVWNETSNTCVILGTTDKIISDPTVTGNTLYTVVGSEPTQYYAVYTSNVADTTTRASNILSYIATSYLDCASNCASNTTCTGFTWNPSTSTCAQSNYIRASNLMSSAGFTSYILADASNLMGSDLKDFGL